MFQMQNGKSCQNSLIERLKLVKPLKMIIWPTVVSKDLVNKFTKSLTFRLKSNV